MKELVENAIDGRAMRIDIAQAKGVGTLIRVTDNGGGILRDDRWPNLTAADRRPKAHGGWRKADG